MGDRPSLFDRPKIKGPRFQIKTNRTWHILLVCNNCLFPLGIPVKLKRREDGFLSWKFLDQPTTCASCGAILIGKQRGNDLVYDGLTNIISARIHSPYRWWNPFTWFEEVEWEMKELEYEVASKKKRETS